MPSPPLNTFFLRVAGILFGLLLLPACETDVLECPTEEYECPAGEQTCLDTDEEGCKEYTFENGECSEVIYCAEIEMTE